MTNTTQRLLILTRHAKAVEDDVCGDHSRALSARGQADAAGLGKWLAAHQIMPEQVFCSTATRTRQTLSILSENINTLSIVSYEESDNASRVGESRAAAHASGGMRVTASSTTNLPTILRDKMYMATAGEILAQVQGADDEVKTLMLVGHNPGMHGLLAMLVSDYVNESDAERVSMKFPTAACAVLRINAEKWSDISPASGVLEHLHWSIDG